MSEDAELNARVADLVARVGGQTRAAEIAGVSRTAIQKWRTGDARLPLLEMQALAEAANVSLEWIAKGRERGSVASGIALLPRRFITGDGKIYDDPKTAWPEIPFRRDWLDYHDIDAARSVVAVVAGDEMAPTIQPLDVVIIDMSRNSLTHAGVFSISRLGRHMLLRVQPRLNGSVELCADNTRYGEEVVPREHVGSLNVQGEVMALLRRLREA